MTEQRIIEPRLSNITSMHLKISARGRACRGAIATSSFGVSSPLRLCARRCPHGSCPLDGRLPREPSNALAADADAALHELPLDVGRPSKDGFSRR